MPTGKAIIPEPSTMVNVPATRGKIPNDFGSSSGSQRVPNKKSTRGTSLKNSADSVANTIIIPAVVITEPNAARAKI